MVGVGGRDICSISVIYQEKQAIGTFSFFIFSIFCELGCEPEDYVFVSLFAVSAVYGNCDWCFLAKKHEVSRAIFWISFGGFSILLPTLDRDSRPCVVG